MHLKILRLIREYDTIIIHRHSRPDGDAIGSQIGLKEALLLTFPKKKVYAVGDETEKYSFIGRMDKISDEEYKNALVFVLDSSEEFLISDERYKTGKVIVKIDHHIFKETYGNVSLVNSDYESCCGLVADFIFKAHLRLNEKAAKALYTGLITDSGRFRFSVTPRTFITASKLVEYNFDVVDIYNNLYNDDLEMVKLRAMFTLKFKVTEDNVAYIKTTKEDLDELGVDLFTVSRTMVNTMAGIKGINIWVNFTEDVENGGVISEIRSNKYNINPIAVKYGGGGHKGASGATLKSFEEAMMMLEDLNKLARGENNETE